MPPGLPTESVSGKEGWEWSRRQADRQNPSVPHTSAQSQFDGHSPTIDRQINQDQPNRPALNSPTQRTEFEHENLHLQRIIDHYERLLSDKNKKLAQQESRESIEQRTPILSTIREFMTV